jgi:two-component system nitrogen regulation sensor histidine kinase NtrY
MVAPMTETATPLSPMQRTADRVVMRASRYAFGTGFAVASVVTALAVFLTAATPGTKPTVPVSRAMLMILSLNLVLILGLATAAGWRALKLFAPGAEDAGVRLHRRFVGLFALAAVLPAIIVALFFGLLVTRGIDSWFSSRIRTVIDNTATLAKSYLGDQEHQLEENIGPMARGLNRPDVADMLKSRPLMYSALLNQAVERDFSSIYIIDSKGRVLARAEAPGAAPFVLPPPATLERAAQAGELETREPTDSDFFRAVYHLNGYPDAFLYVTKAMDPKLLGQMRQSEEAVVTYRDAESGRARIQTVFALSFTSTALLVLVGAIWVGMAAATQISNPVARLVLAADRVAAGDLSARVDTDKDPEEIAVLSRAFNRMTHDLQSQQAALKAASEDALERRLFIEAVLSGVSAGVIGLDSTGRISALNERALTFLGLTGGSPGGRSLMDTAPELAPVARRAAETRQDAEAEVDIVRGAETHRLRVRASGRSDGLVLTFDDITRLVAAQRNAAWRDVARRIAHEIKNPLTPIQLSAERLRRKYRAQISQDLEIFDRCTDTIIRQVGDIGRMVDEFSAFARMPAPKFAMEDAAEILRQAVFAQRVAYPEITVDLENPPAGEGFVCDSRMVGQALTNVLKNAGEAVATRRVNEPALKGRLIARLIVDDEAMTFEVEDNGVGLPARDRERLIEPYVTTREKGTGLGLAIVKRILEEHSGELVLTDAHDLPGARAILRFPRMKQLLPELAYATPATA